MTATNTPYWIAVLGTSVLVGGAVIVAVMCIVSGWLTDHDGCSPGEDEDNE